MLQHVGRIGIHKVLARKSEASRLTIAIAAECSIGHACNW